MDSPKPGLPLASTTRSGDSPGARLDSWKEIAAYLRRDVATVRRWEKREGLPVHRHQHDKLGSVYADTREVDDWCASRSQRLSRESTRDDEPAEPIHANPVARRFLNRRTVAWTAAAVLLAASAAGTTWMIGRRPQPSRVADVEFFLTNDDRVTVAAAAVSPDGSRFAFAGSTAGQPERLWLRPLASTTPIALRGTEGASLPFWSPDGQHLGFFADRKLKKINLSNGAIETICPAGRGRGGSWNHDDVIVFSSDALRPLSQVPAGGGPVTPLTTFDGRRDLGHKWPEFTPDGRHVIYYLDSVDSDREGIYTVTLGSTNQPARLLAVASNAVPTADGRLLFVQGSRLLAQPFDLKRLQLAGEPVVIADPVLQQKDLERKADFSISRTGVLAYRTGSAAPSPLVWFDRQGNRLGTIGEPGWYGAPVLSHDDTHAAVVKFGPDVRRWTAAIWKIELANGSTTRLTVDARPVVTPLWSPNGLGIMYAVTHGPASEIVHKAATGIATEDVVFSPASYVLAEDWSRDGRFLFYSTWDQATKFDTWALPLFGARKPFPVLQGQHSEAQAQLSPNGRFLSFTSNESGRLEVYVTRFPSRDATWQVSSGGGGDARWRRDGRELWYIASDRQLMSVSIDGDDNDRRPAFTHGVPQKLFDTRISDLWNDMRNHYDVTEDGHRFIFAMPIDDDRLGPFTVRVPWPGPTSR